MRTIDLRSDTVTLPTREMLEAITQAGLGDDVSKEDPTVNELQELAARTFGAEAALLVTSGTQGNLVAMMTHCRRGDEMVVESEAHMYYYEVGNMASVAGIVPRLIKGDHGVFTGEQVRKAVRGNDLHFPPSRLLALENTHNRAGGTCWTPTQVADAAKAAHEMGMKVHVDGARIFNASVALGVPVSEYMRHVDSIQFCLSKGLSCPVGSVLVGSNEFIEAARKNRKMLGGGMRQAGIIAAPGIVALNTMVSRLAEDHANARRLVNDLEVLDEIAIDRASVQTNIVVADISATGMTAAEFKTRAREKGLMVSEFGPTSIRFVTHRGIVAEDVDQAATVGESILPACRSGVCSIGAH